MLRFLRNMGRSASVPEGYGFAALEEYRCGISTVPVAGVIAAVRGE